MGVNAKRAINSTVLWLEERRGERKVPQILIPGDRGRQAGLTPAMQAWKDLWILVSNVSATAETVNPGTVDFSSLVPMVQRLRGTVRAPSFHRMLAKIEAQQLSGKLGLTAATLKLEVHSVLLLLVPSDVRYGRV